MKLTSMCLVALGKLVASLFMIGCTQAIRGEGPVGEETRSVARFDEISIGIGAQVEYVRGDENQVIISAQANLLPIIQTEVRSGELRIQTQKPIRSSEPILITVRSPRIKEVTVAGTGEFVTSETLRADDLEFRVAGSGSIIARVDSKDVEAKVAGDGMITLLGAARKADLHVAGSGQINAIDLQTERSDAEIAGSGVIKVAVSDHLDAKIAGSGEIHYQGDAKVDEKIAGTGQVLMIAGDEIAQ